MRQDGIDRGVVFMPVIMVKQNTQEYPRQTLPEGYTFAYFKPGMEHAWSELHFLAGQMDSAQAALPIWEKEFAPHPADCAQRVLFVMDEAGRAIATAALWWGEDFGVRMERIHWVSVDPAHQGRGIARAMLTELMAQYHRLDCTEPIYLTSQTTSNRALYVYALFGFAPWDAQMPPKWVEAHIPEAERAAWKDDAMPRRAWELVRGRWAEYRG